MLLLNCLIFAIFSHLLDCVVWLLGWHVQESLLRLTKFARLFVELLFVLFDSADSILSKSLQRHHDLFVGLRQLEKKKELIGII